MGCFVSTEKRTQRVTKSNSFKFLAVRFPSHRKHSR